jgi:hypothetical protein
MKTWSQGEVLNASDLNNNFAEATNIGVWQDFTATWAGLSGSNNTTIARYMRIGNTVWGHVELTLGTGGSMSGSLFLNVPVTINTAMYLNGFNGSASIGTCRMWDASASGRYTGTVSVNTSAQLRFWTDSAGGSSGAVAGTNPMTWAAGDTFSAEFTYEAS